MRPSEVEDARLDTMWQQLVQERDAAVFRLRPVEAERDALGAALAATLVECAIVRASEASADRHDGLQMAAAERYRLAAWALVLALLVAPESVQ